MTVVQASAQLRGRYLVRHRLLNAALRASDGALRTARYLGLRAPCTPPPGPVRRLLIAIGGHLGDAVLATGAIAAARRAFPSTEIGVVTASWNAPVLEGHPDVARVHVMDHWRSNRTLPGVGGRWRRYRDSFHTARREIVAAGYDAAADTYPYFGNAAVLLWRSRIPWRVGFESGGFGELYSHALRWRPVHMSTLHHDVIGALAHDAEPGAVERTGARRVYDLPPIPPERASAVARRLHTLGAEPGYIVVHMGAGAPEKTWPADRWRPLLEALRAAGRPVVLTGAGEREAALAVGASSGIDGCISVVGQLSWGEFVAVIGGAAGCIAPDTAAAHVAAATGTPVVVLWKGVNDPAQWSPAGSTVVVQSTGSTPGTPNDGRDAMQCSQDFDVHVVVQALLALIGTTR